VTTNEPIMASVAGRYASALFELADDENNVAGVEKDLAAFLSLYDESEDLRRVVRSPVIAADEQARALGSLLEKAEFGQLTQNFFKLITQNRRLFAAPDMARAFQSLAAKSRGEVSADVTSARALSDEQVAALKAKLKESMGKDVQLSLRVDPTLLGGLIVKVGSRMVDGSLRTKLANMRAALAGSA
jgi:F-type H+-transporting ATPase subunit delta